MENRFDLLPYILVFIRRRNALILHFILIVIAAVVYAFFFAKKEYKSEITFLPPTSESSLGSMLSGISLPSMSSSDIMPEQIETIFGSKALKRSVIDKFKLYDHYKMQKNPNKFENTVKVLKKNLILENNEKGSMAFSKTISFSIQAFHTSADTTMLMVNYTFGVLDSAVQAISVDRAHRNRVFIEAQLEKNKLILDTVQKKMQDFQVQNKAYNIPEQVKLSINAYANLKASIMANEIKMQTIKTDFSGETPELTSMQKSNQVYQANLSQIETRMTPDAMPSLANAAKLLPHYTNLLRDVEVQNQVILLVTRELEQAKIKESKNVSSLIVIDPAFVPEFKARPKRVLIMAAMIGIYMSFILFLMIVMEMYQLQIKNSKISTAIKESLK